MIAYHWLRSDLTTGAGNEPAWALGETRRLKGKLVLCSYGYHHSPTLFDGLEYALGAIACRVDVNKSGPSDNTKGCSSRRTLLAYADATVQLRSYVCAVADRAIHIHAVAALRTAERNSDADILAATPPIIDAVSARNAANAANAAYAAGNAAAYAAYAANAAGNAGNAAADAAYAYARNADAAYAAAAAADAAIAAFAAYAAAAAAIAAFAAYAANAANDADAAYAANDADAAYAGYAAERDWQRAYLDSLILPLLEAT